MRKPTTRIYYTFSGDLPVNELGIEVTEDMLDFLIEDKAIIKTPSGRFEFTEKGKDRIREADGLD